MNSSVALRAALFAIASGSAVWTPVLLGRALWPEGLSGGAEFIFWLATAVDVAGLLILGWRYWPVILLNAFSSTWSTGTPLPFTLIAAAGDVICALIAWLALHRFDGDFSRVKAVALFVLCAALGPLPGALAGAGFRIHLGQAAPDEFWMNVGNWLFSDGAAMLLLTPFLVRLPQWRRGRPWRYAAMGMGAIGVGLALEPVFRGVGLNFVFLIYPFVIFVAVSWERQETATALALVLAAAYWAMARYGQTLSPESAPTVIWFLQAFFAVLATTALLLSALVAERRRAETRALEISVLEERARLDALRYQLDPHFLFNALNSIYSTLPVRETNTSRTMITQLSGYLRSTLGNRDGGLVPLRAEVESAENYLAIERVRFGEDLLVDMAFSADALDWSVPGFLLQPLVENAIVHGLAAAPGRFRLELSGRVEEGRLEVEIANIGKWEGREDGVGLDNTRRRLALTYGSAASFEIEASDGWVRVKIKLPSTEGNAAFHSHALPDPR